MLTTRQKLVLAVPLVVAVAAVVILLSFNRESAPTADDRIIEEVSPLPNANALQQAQIVLDMQPGWDASFVIDGRQIPDDQLTKVPAQGRVSFQPGAGKEFEFLQAGQNCVNATYWPLSSPDQKFRKYWCFTAT